MEFISHSSWGWRSKTQGEPRCHFLVHRWPLLAVAGPGALHESLPQEIHGISESHSQRLGKIRGKRKRVAEDEMIG